MRNRPNNRKRTKVVLASRDGGARCHYCGKREKLRKLTLDHVVPQSMGWARTRGRIWVLACAPCNRAKGDLPHDAFVAGVRWVWVPS